MENNNNTNRGLQIKNAAAFNHSAHNLLSTTVQQHQSDENILMMMIPDIIICAFTCELYLKSILYKEQISFERVHNLDELFYLLKKETQDFIEEETINGLRHYAPNRKYDFKISLKDNGNAFVQTRYFYEKNLSIDYLFLNVFVKVLEHTSKEVYDQ